MNIGRWGGGALGGGGGGGGEEVDVVLRYDHKLNVTHYDLTKSSSSNNFNSN